MIFTAASPGAEHRMLRYMKEVGTNARTWAEDAVSTYIDRPVEKGNAPRVVAGAGMTVASAVLEAPDYLIAGALDNKLDPPPNVPFGRIQRDTGQLLKNIVTLHPLRALSDAARLAFTDVPLDGAEALFGFDREKRIHLQRRETKANVQKNLAVTA